MDVRASVNTLLSAFYENQTSFFVSVSRKRALARNDTSLVSGVLFDFDFCTFDFWSIFKIQRRFKRDNSAAQSPMCFVKTKIKAGTAYLSNRQKNQKPLSCGS